MGHSNIKTTALYIIKSHEDEEDIMEWHTNLSNLRKRPRKRPKNKNM
jgi:hypothetical protein